MNKPRKSISAHDDIDTYMSRTNLQIRNYLDEYLAMTYTFGRIF